MVSRVSSKGMMWCPSGDTSDRFGVDEKLTLTTVVKFYNKKSDVIDKKIGIGTGFFYKIFLNNVTYYSIVTNYHVMIDFNSDTFVYYNTYTINENRVKINASEKKLNDIIVQYFSFHEDEFKDVDDDDFVDLALIILDENMLSETEKQNFTLHNGLLGDITNKLIRYGELLYPDIKMIGYPFGESSYPYLRSGVMASIILPGINKFTGDIESVPGSSGSPVFAHANGQDGKRWMIFIGINSGHRRNLSDVYLKNTSGYEKYILDDGSELKSFAHYKLSDIINCNQLKIFENHILKFGITKKIFSNSTKDLKFEKKIKENQSSLKNRDKLQCSKCLRNFIAFIKRLF
jgi:V8-like Glu-specific endopeptidase